MEPIEFKTPSGYKVTIKPRLNFGENQQIRQAIREHMMIEIKTQIGREPTDEDLKIKEISLASLMAGQEIALEILVLKVADSNGVELGDPVAAINNMPIEDGDAVMDKINEITQKAEAGKDKKRGS